MQEVKVYANKEAFGIQDEGVIERYKSFVTNAPLFSEMPEFKEEYIAFCNELRQGLGINNVISFSYVEEKNVLLILTYDVFANQGLTYQQGFDETGPYMVMVMQDQA